jgi:hypothetical protein
MSYDMRKHHLIINLLYTTSATFSVVLKAWARCVGTKRNLVEGSLLKNLTIESFMHEGCVIVEAFTPSLDQHESEHQKTQSLCKEVGHGI